MGKSYREFLILLGEDIKLSKKKKKKGEFFVWFWGEKIKNLFQKIIQKVSCKSCEKS